MMVDSKKRGDHIAMETPIYMRVVKWTASKKENKDVQGVVGRR